MTGNGRKGREKPYVVTNAVRSLCHGVSHEVSRDQREGLVVPFAIPGNMVFHHPEAEVT